MKLFKKRNIQVLIYGLFMLLPFLSILGRVLYTQWNQEAYQSYYGETINQEEYHYLSSFEQLQPGNYYQYKSGLLSTLQTQDIRTHLYVRNFEFYTTPTILEGIEINQLTLYYNSDYPFIRFNDTSAYTINLTNNEMNFKFNFISGTNLDKNTSLCYVFTTTYNQYSYLDNAFEYSIDRFVDENNFGNFDFFQWFSTFFLQDNAVNNFYVHFINWYMNYMLYVSLGYLIFSILMWFVNFFRSLVEKSTDLNL